MIFRQIRVGKLGKCFTIYKIETIKNGKIGRFYKYLRRYHLDELPQIFNIIRGEMTLVGPRPEQPHLHNNIKKIFPDFEKRLIVKPGLTGLAQVKGIKPKNINENRKKIKYDLFYIKRKSFRFDLYILWLTFKKIFCLQ